MSKSFENSDKRIRDGTSQTARQQKALDPDYVSLDERGLEDLLAFAQKYAMELNYYNENNQVQGDWRSFLNPNMDLAQVAAYARDPARLSPDKARDFKRPHFALLLSFLRLLEKTQHQLNGFTRRHLEFYYHQCLGMTRKTAVADRVNVLLRPTPRVSAVEVPEGHLLKAGRDSSGRDLFYRTDRRILVNHAQIGRLSAVFAERQVTSIRQAREQFKGTRQDAILHMLTVALGDPLPGDPLPKGSLPTYGDNAGEPATEIAGETITYDKLLALAVLVNFSHDPGPDSGLNGLFLAFFELRSLMRLKHQRDAADDEWARINGMLEVIYRVRSNNPGLSFELDDPQDFNANLVKALDRVPDFGGLTQVENIDDLYHERNREDVKNFIRDELYFVDFDDFVIMMQIKVKIDNEWAEINRLLELAGQRKRDDGTWQLQAEDGLGFHATDFAANFDTALNYDAERTVDFQALSVADIDAYYVAFKQVEAYFYISAENFAYLMAVVNQAENKTHSSEWDKVYDILAEAYRAKVFEQRREQLKQQREAGADMARGFHAMLLFALGEKSAEGEASALPRLQDHVSSVADYEYLTSVETAIKAGEVAIDWARVYRIVELAQRNRQRLPEPVARIQRWINLNPHADVKASTGPTTLADPDNPRWQTFGGPLPTMEGEPPPAIIGWAIGSPLLLLSAGRRKIVLTLGFERDDYDADRIDALFPAGVIPAGQDTGPFQLQVSSGENWIVPDSVETRIGDYSTLSGVTAATARTLTGLKFILNFSEQLDPIVAPDGISAAGEAGCVACEWPVLRLMLRQRWDADSGQYLTDYAPFEVLKLVHAHLKVRVGNKNVPGPSGLGELFIQNDQTILNAKKPFLPFGGSPVVGSRFYLGHPEINAKRLDSLSIGIEWMGVPDDLKSHYTNYGIANFEGSFTTRLSLVNQRVAYTLVEDAALFAAKNASDPHSIVIKDVGAALTKARQGYIYRRSLTTPVGDDLLDWRRYIQWELTPLDFQHQAYPRVSASKSIALATAIANKKNTDNIVPGDYTVNPPYTPKIKQLDLHYSASLELDLSAYTLDQDRSGDQTQDRIFHIHPFGHNAAQPQDTGGCWFLPEYAAEGELYIGITGATPPQSLSVLFQMAEGSANPDRQPVPIDWHYLSGDRWLSLADGGIRLDSTRGLINSGIIEFDIRPVDPSTRLAPEYYWIRATIDRHSDSVCDGVDIQAQAISATLLGDDYAPDHYIKPLAENSITGLSPTVPGIAELLQPYTSFGGKAPEQDSIFYTRVSERLRHKQRALTVWDYERLVLERFAQIYKVKCLPASALADVAAKPDEAGRVSLVVIPDVRRRLPFDPFGPKAPADLIKDIETYLEDKIPAYASVQVRNAHFVPVKVRIGVRFRAGYDVGFYRARLTRDLNRFLSPWAFDEGADIVIGGRIYANSIVNFLDQRDYVDYVAGIKLFSSEDGRTFRLVQKTEAGQGYYVTTEKPDAVLVAAHEHEIDVIEEKGYTDEQFTGINYMKVELDFVVAEDID